MFIAKLLAEAKAYEEKAAQFTSRELTEAANLASAVADKLNAWAAELQEIADAQA